MLQTALTYLGNATIECEQPGTFLYDTMCSGADAYVRAAWALLRTGNIHLCMGSFDTDPTQYKAEVLIHEATHRSSNTSDNGCYRSDWSESSQTVGPSSDQRLDNADSFAKFVHPVAHESDTTLVAQAAEWRGDKLTLTQRPPGAISLAAGALSTTFKVEGWPGGGFTFRWVIAEAYGTAADRRYMVRAVAPPDAERRRERPSADAATPVRPLAQRVSFSPWPSLTSSGARSTPSAYSRWTRCRRRTPAIPGPRWRSRRSPT